MAEGLELFAPPPVFPNVPVFFLITWNTWNIGLFDWKSVSPPAPEQD